MLAKRKQCQVVATTHSYECVKGALLGSQMASQTGDLGYTRLDRIAGVIKAKTYEPETISSQV